MAYRLWIISILLLLTAYGLQLTAYASIAIEEFTFKDGGFKALCRNLEKSAVDLSGEVKVRNSTGKIIRILPLKGSIIPPGSARELRAKLGSAFPRGKFYASVLISLRGKIFSSPIIGFLVN